MIKFHPERLFVIVRSRFSLRLVWGYGSFVRLHFIFLNQLQHLAAKKCENHLYVADDCFSVVYI